MGRPLAKRELQVLIGGRSCPRSGSRDRASDAGKYHFTARQLRAPTHSSSHRPRSRLRIYRPPCPPSCPPSWRLQAVVLLVRKPLLLLIDGLHFSVVDFNLVACRPGTFNPSSDIFYRHSFLSLSNICVMPKAQVLGRLRDAGAHKPVRGKLLLSLSYSIEPDHFPIQVMHCRQGCLDPFTGRAALRSSEHCIHSNKARRTVRCSSVSLYP